METSILIIFILCALAIIIFGKILIIPLKSLIKLVLNSVLGGILIYVVNLVGTLYNFHIGLNVYTAILIGILGVPGVFLLIFLKLFFG